MVNLLPTEDRKIVRKEYLLRLLTVGLLLLTAISVVGSLLTLPTLFAARARNVSIQDQAQLIAQASEISKSNLSLQILIQTNAELEQLDKARTQKHVYNILASAVDERPANVSITRLFYAPAGEEPQLVINGVARTREALLSFERNLKNSGDFYSVNLPVSNLAKESDIVFSIKMVPQL